MALGHKKDDGGLRRRGAEKKAPGLGSNIMWNSVGNFVYLVSQWLFTYLVANLLGFEAAGVFSLATSISSSFYMVANYTMRTFQVSDVAREYPDEAYVTSRYATSAVSVAACAVFALASGYPEASVVCILLYMLFKVTEAVSDAYQGALQLRMRLDYVGKSFVAKGVAELALFWAAIALFHNLNAAVAVLFASSALLVLAIDGRLAHRFYRPRVAPARQVLALLRECLPSAAYGMLFTTAGQLPKIFLEGRMGSEALGFYSSIAMPVLIIQVSASFVFSPLATPLAEAREKGDSATFDRLMTKVFAAIAVVGVLGVAGFALCGGWFYALLFGEAILPYTYLSIPLTICSVLVALSWFMATVLTVMRRLKTLLALSAAALAIVVAATMPAIGVWGMNGATFAYVAALVVFNAGCLAVIFRR